MCSKHDSQCLNCGKRFPSVSGKASIYCSHECYWSYMRSSGAYKRGSVHQYKCSKCGSPVSGRDYSTNRDGGKSDKIFCSRDCYDNHRMLVVENRMEACKICGSKFDPFQVGSNRPPKKYCSQSCRVEAKKPGPVNCVNCGCEFSAIKIMKRRSGLKFARVSGMKTCSQKCALYWVSNNQKRKEKISTSMTGDRHPNWQGGPQFRHRGARGAGWQKARRAALKRDGHKCQHCGMTEKEHIEKTGKGLEVNHKTPFWQYRGDNAKANSLSNLESLCKSCHQKADWHYRKSNPIQLGLAEL